MSSLHTQYDSMKNLADKRINKANHIQVAYIQLVVNFSLHFWGLKSLALIFECIVSELLKLFTYFLNEPVLLSITKTVFSIFTTTLVENRMSSFDNKNKSDFYNCLSRKLSAWQMDSGYLRLISQKKIDQVIHFSLI